MQQHTIGKMKNLTFHVLANASKSAPVEVTLVVVDLTSNPSSLYHKTLSISLTEAEVPEQKVAETLDEPEIVENGLEESSACIVISKFQVNKKEEGLFWTNNWDFTVIGRINNRCQKERRIGVLLITEGGLAPKSEIPHDLVVNKERELMFKVSANGSTVGSGRVILLVTDLTDSEPKAYQRILRITIPRDRLTPSTDIVQLTTVFIDSGNT